MIGFCRVSALTFSLLATWLATTEAQASDKVVELDILLAQFHETYDFPGITAAVAFPDGTVVSAAFGLADVEAGVQMNSDNRMLAASIGKTFVAALVLSLETDGVLRRSDLIADYLSDLPWFEQLPNADEITIWHLLTHTAGLPDHVYIKGAVLALVTIGQAETFKPSDAIAYILDQPPLFEAGGGWAYSDTGYLLLGLVIEAATGGEVFGLINDRFLIPLELAQTQPSNRPELAGLPVGYTAENNAFGLPSRTSDADGDLLWNPAIEWTGGGFVSTSHDLAVWGQALFTGMAMEAAYLDRLLEAVPIDANAPDVLYWSGVAIYADTEFGPVYGHGGWVPGYVSSLRHYADHNITITFQINTDIGVVDDSTDLVPALETALAHLFIETATGK